MINDKGKSERDAKQAILKLKNFLEHGQKLTLDDKEKLLQICNALLNDEDIYSKNELGRKEEANFQKKIAEHFQVFLLKKSGYTNQQIIDLVPQVGEERNISRMITRLKTRLEIKNEKGEHWYRLCEGYLKKYYDDLIKQGRLKNEDYEKIESFLEDNIQYTCYSEGSNMFMIDRIKFAEKFHMTTAEEKERFLRSLKENREFTISNSRTSKKI